MAPSAQQALSILRTVRGLNGTSFRSCSSSFTCTSSTSGNRTGAPCAAGSPSGPWTGTPRSGTRSSCARAAMRPCGVLPERPPTRSSSASISRYPSCFSSWDRGRQGASRRPLVENPASTQPALHLGSPRRVLYSRRDRAQCAGGSYVGILVVERPVSVFTLSGCLLAAFPRRLSRLRHGNDPSQGGRHGGAVRVERRAHTGLRCDARMDIIEVSQYRSGKFRPI